MTIRTQINSPSTSALTAPVTGTPPNKTGHPRPKAIDPGQTRVTHAPSGDVRSTTHDNSVTAQATTRADIAALLEPSKYGKSVATYESALTQVESWAQVDPLAARGVTVAVERAAKANLPEDAARSVSKRAYDLRWTIRDACDVAEAKRDNKLLTEFLGGSGKPGEVVDKGGDKLTFGSAMRLSQDQLRTLSHADGAPAELGAQFEGHALNALKGFLAEWVQEIDAALAKPLDNDNRRTLYDREHWMAPLAFGSGRCETDQLRSIIDATKASHPALNQEIRATLVDVQLVCLRVREALVRGSKSAFAAGERAQQLHVPTEPSGDRLAELVTDAKCALSDGDGAFANRLIAAGDRALGRYEMVRTMMKMMGDDVDEAKIASILQDVLPPGVTRAQADATLDGLAALATEAKTKELAQSIELLLAHGITYRHNVQSRAQSLIERFDSVMTADQKAELTDLIEKSEVLVAQAFVDELKAGLQSVRDAPTVRDADMSKAMDHVESAKYRQTRKPSVKLHDDYTEQHSAVRGQMGTIAAAIEAELGPLGLRSVPGYREAVEAAPADLKDVLQLHPRWGRQIQALAAYEPELAAQLVPVEAARHLLTVNTLNAAIKDTLANGDAAALKTIKRDVEYYQYLTNDSEAPMPTKFDATAFEAAGIDATKVRAAEITLAALIRQLDARLAS